MYTAMFSHQCAPCSFVALYSWVCTPCEHIHQSKPKVSPTSTSASLGMAGATMDVGPRWYAGPSLRKMFWYWWMHIPNGLRFAGTCFMSVEFKEFVRKNRMHHITSSPYPLASNSLTEHAVQWFKVGMKKAGKGSIETNLARFLFRYCITPHSTAGRSPTKLLMGRRHHSDLNQLLLGQIVPKRVRRGQKFRS